MEEYIGECVFCQKKIYCSNGFLDGNVKVDGRLTCFHCMTRGDDEDHF